jgi:hypothetical protein
MPHPCDHPAAALAITRALPNQLAKAKQNGDTAAAQAIEAALARARRIIAQPPASQAPRVPSAPVPIVERRSLPAKEEGWAEVVVDNRRRRWR